MLYCLLKSNYQLFRTIILIILGVVIVRIFAVFMYRIAFCFAGVLYHRWGKYDLAEQYYRKALSINANEANVRENLAMLLQKMGKTKNKAT